MTRIDRRTFLTGTAAAGARPWPDPSPGSSPDRRLRRPQPVLGPVPDDRDGIVRLYLPRVLLPLVPRHRARP